MSGAIAATFDDVMVQNVPAVPSNCEHSFVIWRAFTPPAPVAEPTLARIAAVTATAISASARFMMGLLPSCALLAPMPRAWHPGRPVSAVPAPDSTGCWHGDAVARDRVRPPRRSSGSRPSAAAERDPKRREVRAHHGEVARTVVELVLGDSFDRVEDGGSNVRLAGDGLRELRRQERLEEDGRGAALAHELDQLGERLRARLGFR